MLLNEDDIEAEAIAAANILTTISSFLFIHINRKKKPTSILRIISYILLILASNS